MATRVEEVSNPRVELALDARGREVGEQCGTPDCIESLRYSMSRDGPDLMTDIEGLHSFWWRRSSMSKVEYPGLKPNW